jgi:SAM-dependent methyltransferase
MAIRVDSVVQRSGSIAGFAGSTSVPCQEGNLLISTEGPGRLRMELHPHDSSLFVPIKSWVTSLPQDILEFLASHFEFPWLCDHIARIEDPNYVARTLRRQLSAYFFRADLAGKRMLDFGCGTGASAIIMAEWLPELQIIGAELDPHRVEMAQRIAKWKGLSNVSFHASPTPDSLPREVGQVDLIMLSAVYEHLLPTERKTLMPLLWSHLRPNGVILINQTPFRWSPYEHHTTGLWGINYLPDFLACYLGRHHSKIARESNRGLDWEGLLRHGIRGGSEREILGNLQHDPKYSAVILQPAQNGLRDRADYWESCTSSRHRALKRTIARAFRLSDRFFGMIPATHIDVAIQKVEKP